jgi:hypothetical protein
MVLAVVFVVLFATGLIVSTALAGGVHFPSPLDSLVERQTYFSRHFDAVLANAFFQFGSAIPLGLFTAVIVSRLQFLGLRAAGVFIALFGGIAASLLIVIGSLCQWVLAQPEVAGADGVWQAFHFMAFACGGPGHVVTLGLLVAGVSVSAGLAHELPKWIAVFGLVVAALSELAIFSLIAAPAVYLLPIARLGALVWMICAAWSLPKATAHREDEPASPRAATGPITEAWGA